MTKIVLFLMLLLTSCKTVQPMRGEHYFYVWVEDNCKNMNLYSEIVLGEFTQEDLIDQTKKQWFAEFPDDKCERDNAVFHVVQMDSKESIEKSRKHDMDEAVDNDRMPMSVFVEFFN
jgi:hypothetical protein